MKLKLFFFGFLLCSHVIAQDERTAKIDSILNANVNDSTPGLFIGVVQNGEIVYEGYGGLANLQHSAPITETTPCNIASVAKQFTALMILDLAMKKELNLEDDIRKYIPGIYPDVKEEIKIRHLINHTSGIRDYCDLMGLQGDAWWRRVGLDNDDVIEFMEKQNDLGSTPGEIYRYSNTGYIILAEIIEAVKKTSFSDYSKAFFESMGMNNTMFRDNYMGIIPNMAAPYSDWGDGVWQQYPTLVDVHGDGNLFTTLRDQLIYEQAVQKAKEDVNELLLQSQEAVPNAEITTYGFGLELEDKFGFKAIHHAGGTGSYSSQLYRFPDQRLAVFVMSNNSNVWVDGVARRVAKMYLPKKERVYDYPTAITNTDELTSGEILGYYASADGYIISIEEAEGGIQWRNATYNPYKLNKEENMYSFEVNSSLKALFAKDRVIYSTGNGIKEDYYKLHSQQPSIQDKEQIAGKYFSKELGIGFELFWEEGKLMALVADMSNPKEVKIVNRDKLIVMGYFLTIDRDSFERTSAIMLTSDRAANTRFDKVSELKLNSKIPTEYGSISITTVYSANGESSNILVSKNNESGNQIWFKQYGGKSYDKASSIYATEDGYLLVGSTSSYGAGNYDVLLMKIDQKGKKVWQQTYGKRMNDYGFTVEETKSGYLLKGTTQTCDKPESLLEANCETNIWLLEIDKNGNQLSEIIGERYEN